MNELTIHGSIIFLFKKFVLNTFPQGSWEDLIANTSLHEDSVELTRAYPLQTINELVHAASEKTGIDVEKLKEDFGEHIVPDLFQLYKHYLQPDWKTYEILLKTEEVMHGAVRKLNSTATPPVLNVSKISDELLIIDYTSKRKMGSLAVGIIKGIARFYGEEKKVSITIMTNPEAEQVQLQVHFAKN